jgi:hypothetical protein
MVNRKVANMQARINVWSRLEYITCPEDYMEM